MKKYFYVFDPKKPRDYVVARGSLFIAIGLGFALLNLLLLPIVGIQWGIDFAGGMEMQVRFAKQADADSIRAVLEQQGFAKNQVQQYGDDRETSEWLVRVERVTTLTSEQLDALKVRVEEALAMEGARIDFTPSEGDRFRLIVDVPKADGMDSDAIALAKKLDDQQAKIALAVEDAGMRLRRTFAANGTETTADAIVRDEPYQGKVTYLVQLQGVSDKIAKALADALGDAEIRRVDFVDATVAEQLKTDGFLALLISLGLILVYVAIRFDIYFAPGALIALVHDPIGALCVYTIARMDFDLPSVAAMLTVIGYSINNTIVIYDRIRETTPSSTTPLSDVEMKQVVTSAVSTTLNRTFNSTVTTLFTSVAVWIFTEGAVRTFAACLSVGIMVGAYSSILMAPSFYLMFRRWFFKPHAAQEAKPGPTREERERGIV